MLLLPLVDSMRVLQACFRCLPLFAVKLFTNWGPSMLLPTNFSPNFSHSVPSIAFLTSAASVANEGDQKAKVKTWPEVSKKRWLASPEYSWGCGLCRSLGTSFGLPSKSDKSEMLKVATFRALTYPKPETNLEANGFLDGILLLNVCAQHAVSVEGHQLRTDTFPPPGSFYIGGK